MTSRNLKHFAAFGAALVLAGMLCSGVWTKCQGSVAIAGRPD